MAVVYVGEFLLGKALALPAEPFMTKLFADKSIPDVILTLLTIFILAPLNEETLFRGIMLNVFRSRYSWTMWLGALITSLLFVAVYMQQYQNLQTPKETFHWLLSQQFPRRLILCLIRYRHSNCRNCLLV